MKYVLKETKTESGTYTFEKELEGFIIHAKKDKSADDIDIKEVIITDAELIDKHIKRIFDKKINEISKMILLILNSDDSTDDDVSMVLDETSKFKSIIINKYKKYISDKLYKTYMKKVIIMEEEFKRSFMYNKYYLENEIIRGRSR